MTDEIRKPGCNESGWCQAMTKVTGGMYEGGRHPMKMEQMVNLDTGEERVVVVMPYGSGKSRGSIVINACPFCRGDVHARFKLAVKIPVEV